MRRTCRLAVAGLAGCVLAAAAGVVPAVPGVAGRGVLAAPVGLRDVAVRAAGVIGPLAAAGPAGLVAGLRAGRRDEGR
jgi:hypothetical protein